MVMLEGIEIKMNTKLIRKRRLVEAWKTLLSKPLQKVKAFELKDKDFNHVIQRRHCLEDELCDLEELGRVLSTKGTDACVFNVEQTEDADYIILVRENPYHSLDEIILHELSHILRGDL